MKIIVATANGSAFDFDLVDTTTVLEVKLNIFEQMEFDLERYVLTHNDNTLDDSGTLSSVGVTDGDFLMLIKPRPVPTGNESLIFIKTLTGKNIDVTIDLNSTVERLKEIIQECEGIPPDQQRLVFAGTQMEDDKKISEYGVQKHSTVHLILRLSGGKPVILFYPPKSIKFDSMTISTELVLPKSWTITALYPPVDKKCEESKRIVWQSELKSNDQRVLIDAATKISVPYLFWEVDADPTDKIVGLANLIHKDEKEPMFVIKAEDFANFLNQQLDLFGLNATEKTDFITYWIHLVHGKKNVVMKFIPQEQCNSYFPLCVKSSLEVPIALKRILMIFCTTNDEVKGKFLTSPQPIDGFPQTREDDKSLLVVEWGAFFAGHQKF